MAEAIAELTEQSTSDEVKEYAERVVKEVEAERAGEEKGDARITAEHADNEHKPERAKETLAEKKSGEGKSADAKSEGESSAKAEKAGEESWFDEDLKAEATALGLEESELADFASREEFDRALRLFDKIALVAGQKAMAEEEKGATGRDEKGRFLKKDEKPKAEPKPEEKSEAADGKYEIKLDKAVYDEEIVSEFTRMRDHYEDRLKAFETLETRFKALEDRFHESDAKAEEDRFDSAIDKLDMPKLFGVTGKETPDELKKREEVMAQARVLQAGYRTFGRDVELGSMVSRAAPMVFSSEFEKHNLKNRTRKISKQADGRQGGGATRPQDPREDPRDEFDRKFKEMGGHL